MNSMPTPPPVVIFILLITALIAPITRAQSESGTLNFTARIAPTAARPEPVRQYTFYVLTKSYADIVKEVEEQNAVLPREKFIDDLKVSTELKNRMKAHDVFDLTMP